MKIESRNYKLNILRRKQIGKHLVDSYKILFRSFDSYIFYDLQESDIIIDKMRELVSQKSNRMNEFLNEEENFLDSDLLKNVYLNQDEFSLSYIFTENYTYCGIFLVKSREAIKNILEITKLADGNTSFLIGHNFDYSFTINYYDSEHNDHPRKFDIQRSI